jgi:hypothetical protein
VPPPYSQFIRHGGHPTTSASSAATRALAGTLLTRAIQLVRM